MYGKKRERARRRLDRKVGGWWVKEGVDPASGPSRLAETSVDGRPSISSMSSELGTVS